MTEGKFFTIANSREPFRRDTKRNEVITRRLCSFGAESQIVLGGASAVTVALDLNLGLRVVP
jgi:hypothetical protein